MEGMQIGQYRIERQLGHGGFGVVYIGVDVRLGRRAAIKQLLPELSNNREIVERFFNEAKAAANINHPGIVEIYDVGWHTDGSAYFAMKLLDGDSLSKRLRSGPLALPVAATIARQVASALVAAHARGIVHRDLKPDNIILVPDDEVAIGERAVVLDFGIAKLGGSQGMSHTRSGMMMGTPGYMSPEQCRGAGEVDHRTDIYALGCILFEMLTGRMPFLGEGPGEVMGMHQFVEPPTVRSLRADASPEVEALVARLLAKKLDQRLQQMSDVHTALQVFATGGRSREQPAVAPGASTALPQVPVSPVARTAVSEREQPAPRLDPVSAAAQQANVPPQTNQQNVPTVLPSPAPAVRAQQSTFASARGEVSPVDKATSSKKGLLIGLGVVGVAGIGIAIAVGAGGSKSTPVTAVADAAVTMPADAAVAVAPATPDAAQAPKPGIDAPSPLLADCQKLMTDRKWPDVIECATKLANQDPSKAKELTARANSEGKAEVALREMNASAKKRDQDGVYAGYNKIPSDSAYRAEARDLFDRFGKDFVAAMVRQHKDFAAQKNCKELEKRMTIYREQSKKLAGTPNHYDEVIKQVQGIPCTASSTSVASTTGSTSVGSTTGSTSTRKMDCPPGTTARWSIAEGATVCVKPATTTTSPGGDDLCADPNRMAELEAEGDQQMSNGRFAAAHSTFEQVRKCKPSVITKAYLAACKAQLFAKAKLYYRMIGKDNLAQICLKEGFDPR